MDTGEVVVSGSTLAFDQSIVYRSSHKKVLSTNLPLFASVCLDCGSAELYIESARLKKKMK